MPLKVLFLDMDGVMNDQAFYEYAHENRGKFTSMNELNRRAATHINPVNAMNLRYILKEAPDVRIVISSTWRKYYTLSEMKYLLGKVGIPKEKIIGMTGVLPKGQMEGRSSWGDPNMVQRGDLCKHWALENNVDEFVCVDDDNDFDNVRDRLVRTNGKNGLTRTKAEDILKLFGAFTEEPNLIGRDVYTDNPEDD